eukprot:gene17873-23489_t
MEMEDVPTLVDDDTTILCSTTIVIAPLALEVILAYVKTQGSSNTGSVIALPFNISLSTAVVMLFCGPALKAIGDNQNYARGRHVAIRVKSALISAVYKKSLTVDLTTLNEGVGKVNNLISVDVAAVQDFFAYSHFLWSTPYEIVICMTLLFLVLGPTGSGKSTLLAGILGECRQSTGNVNIAIKDSISYVTQSAWIQNATLRDNILFGNEYDHDRYMKVLFACALLDDIKLLEAGDMTEIGEKGVNLSGGQQQRVSLGRAAYSKNNIIIMDDPLSAVDSHVGQHIFQHLICNFLSDRTRILVTHQVAIAAPVADMLICLDNQGNNKLTTGSGKLIDKEKKQVGEVPITIYWFYAKACGGIIATLLLLFCCIWIAVSWVLENYSLGLWMDSLQSGNSYSRIKSLAVYIIFTISVLLSAFIRSLLEAILSLRAAQKIHDNMTRKVVLAPCSWFDTTPLGRIVNRFSQDISTVDKEIMNNFSEFLDCALVAGCVGLGVVFSAGTIGNTTAGLALIYSLSFTENLTFLARTHANVQMNLNSIERIQEYTVVKSEKYHTKESSGNKSETDDEIPPTIVPKTSVVPSNWPSHGNIEFVDINVKYSSSTNYILNKVNFKVPNGKKVGIVGRTGAGKSTLISSLFRTVEPESGVIMIDGVNILNIPLHTLRSRVAIVPQEPILFQGSIRSNLDPFSTCRDEDLWNVLKSVHLSEYVSSMPGGTGGEYGPLEDKLIAEKGSNLSVGQRQLLCMARALLRKAPILVLDECTANVDHETDTLIQDTVRNELTNITVLCIAHRLHTIAFYDLVLVMDKGSVAEYDSPLKLMQDEKSIFYSMCMNSGDFDNLYSIAKAAS